MKIEITKSTETPVTKFFSATPETDMEHAKFAMGGFTLDFCRKLERERDELQREVDLLKKTPLRQRCQELEKLADHWCDMHTIAAKERDEAITRRLETIMQCELYEQERNEARKQNAKLRDIAEQAINFGEYRAPCLAYPGPTWEKLRAELDQLKEDAK